MRRQQLERLAGIYKHIGTKYTCAYCGAYADTVDHVVPVSVAAYAYISRSKRIKVSCCRECNSIGGNMYFRSIGAKRRYIQEQLKRRYSKYLNLPNWTEQQLEQLGWTMRQSIEQAIRLRELIKERINWRIALGATRPSRRKGIGKSIAQKPAAKLTRLQERDERATYLMTMKLNKGRE